MNILRIEEIKEEIKNYENKLKDKNIREAEVDDIAYHIEHLTLELERELHIQTQEVQSKIDEHKKVTGVV